MIYVTSLASTGYLIGYVGINTFLNQVTSCFLKDGYTDNKRRVQLEIHGKTDYPVIH